MRTTLGLGLSFLGALAAACADPAGIVPLPTPQLTASPATSVASRTCVGPQDTASSVWGVVSERTPEGRQPLAGVFVELYEVFYDPGDEEGWRTSVTGAFTNESGRYALCLPIPHGGSGATGPDGQAFGIWARKDGYFLGSGRFTHAYSVWDYGAVELNVELVRR